MHVHAVVPGGGPSLKQPGTWKSAAPPPPHERPDRWWLVDADVLRVEFRNQFLKGLRQLHVAGELKLEGDWAHLQDSDAFEASLKPLETQSWVTYIQPPPTESSQPEDIVKYLARYLTGGPISDHRLVSYENGKVTFTARTGCQERPAEAAGAVESVRRIPLSDVNGPPTPSPAEASRHGGSDETEEVQLPVHEFVRRWCLHILPKGFTKTRCYGGWSNPHSQRYVSECREHQQQRGVLEAAELSAVDAADNITVEVSCGRPCPTCGSDLELLERVHRTSWRDIFSGADCPTWNTFRDRPG